MHEHGEYGLHDHAYGVHDHVHNKDGSITYKEDKIGFVKRLSPVVIKKSTKHAPYVRKSLSKPLKARSYGGSYVVKGALSDSPAQSLKYGLGGRRVVRRAGYGVSAKKPIVVKAAKKDCNCGCTLKSKDKKPAEKVISKSYSNRVAYRPAEKVVSKSYGNRVAYRPAAKSVSYRPRPIVRRESKW